MRHTPGPWSWCEVGDTGGDNPMPVYEVIAGNYERGAIRIAEHIADGNAQLIAAAPDLAWALERMLREHDALQMASGSTEDRWEAATYARAMLAKARGE